MLSQQENAWAVYAAVFLFFTVFLSLRCRKNLLLIPFVVFGLLVTVGTICLLAAHSGVSSTISNAIASAAQQHQESFTLNRYWQGKSLSLSLLPAASILLLFGIMEAQIIFIRHMAVALHNRDHWGSIYLRDPEKSRGFVVAASTEKKKKKRSLRPWTYWTTLVILFIYLIAAMSSVIIQTTDDGGNKNLGVAICVSILCVLSFVNVGVIWCSCNSSANHVRTIRQNRDDLKFLRFTPVLFSILMTGLTLLSWVYYSVPDVSMSLWIVLESFTVYLPLLCIMMMCIYTSKIQTMGRQYPIEAAQYPKFQQQYSYQTVKDMEQVTKKLSQEEANKQITTPPPATYHSYSR